MKQQPKLIKKPPTVIVKIKYIKKEIKLNFFGNVLIEK